MNLWIDFTLDADGDKHNLEVEVVGQFQARWIGEKREFVIESVNLIGADTKVNILPALSAEVMKAIAAEVLPMARLQEGRPGPLSEAA